MSETILTTCNIPLDKSSGYKAVHKIKGIDNLYLVETDSEGCLASIEKKRNLLFRLGDRADLRPKQLPEKHKSGKLWGYDPYIAKHYKNVSFATRDELLAALAELPAIKGKK